MKKKILLMYREEIADLIFEMAMHFKTMTVRAVTKTQKCGCILTRAAAIFSIQLLLNSCSSPTKVETLPPVPPEPPGYVKVPHPEGLDQGDLLAIFTDKGAPPKESFESCDADFQTLRSKTNSKDEITTGARELVRLSPEKMHWCFYGKILLMEENLKNVQYIDEKQKTVLDTYLFLTPISRAFFIEFRDSRYLRWAVTRYRKLSETVFYRKVEMTQQLNEELVAPANPLGAERLPAEKPQGVLEKYGLVPQSDVNVPSSGNYIAPSGSLAPEKAAAVSIQSDPTPDVQLRAPATSSSPEQLKVETAPPVTEPVPAASPTP